jgi:hypothetical protein
MDIKGALNASKVTKVVEKVQHYAHFQIKNHERIIPSK